MEFPYWEFVTRVFFCLVGSGSQETKRKWITERKQKKKQKFHSCIRKQQEKERQSHPSPSGDVVVECVYVCYVYCVWIISSWSTTTKSPWGSLKHFFFFLHKTKDKTRTEKTPSQNVVAVPLGRQVSLSHQSPPIFSEAPTNEWPLTAFKK